MKRHFYLALCLIGCSVVLSACAAEELPSPTTVAEAVARHMQPLIEDGRIVGAAVAVVQDGEATPFFFGEVKQGSGERPDGDTMWEIGSISKVFTGTLLALLSQEGMLKLEDPVQPVLAGLAYGEGDAGPVFTLAQLAEHSSGLPRLPDNKKPADPANPYADYTVDDLYAFLAKHKLRRAPGEAHEYSNLGVGLLGHVLALKAGRSYEDLLREKLLVPLHMNDTAVTLTEVQEARMAKPYAQGGKPASNWDIPTFAGAGGLRSSLNDMTRFLLAAMGDAPEPLEKAFALAQEPRFKVGENVQIGLCWMITESSTPGSPPLIWHNGGTGGYASFVGFRQDGSLGIVVLCNTAERAIDQAAVEIMRDIHEITN
jgi:CubicO group peptidase (beta-lactamase class C family)